MTKKKILFNVLKEKIEAVKNQEGLGTYVAEQLDNFNIAHSDVVDWDKDIEDNAQAVINKWVEDYFDSKED